MTEATNALSDVQNSEDQRKIAINKVGIKDIRHPVQVKDRSGQVQHTVANFNMYVDLPHQFKGTHMSRFVKILNDNEKEIIALRFGLDDRDPQTLDTIGRQFGVTRERIRQIEAKSLEKLRTLLAERDPSTNED